MVVISCKNFCVNLENAPMSCFVRTAYISDLTKGKILVLLKDHVLANLYLVGLCDNLSRKMNFSNHLFRRSKDLH